MVDPSSADVASCHRPSARRGVFRHPPGVLIPGFVIDTRDVPAIPPGRPWGDREREKRWTGPLRRARPQPPPPRFPNASRHPLRGVGSDNMIPAPVRSVPQTDRWCLRLLTIMQRGCDTSIPLWRRGRSLRGCCEWVGMPIVERRRFQNTANQRLRTLGTRPANDTSPCRPPRPQRLRIRSTPARRTRGLYLSHR